MRTVGQISLALKIGKELLEEVKDGVNCVSLIAVKPAEYKSDLQPIEENVSPTIMVPESSLKELSNSELNEDVKANSKISKKNRLFIV
jgi:hypothetical protein